MTNAYRAVQWNPHKRRYDAVVALAILLGIGGFVGVSIAVLPREELPSEPILLLRALGAVAGTLLTVILCIGPLARLDRRFAPFLYNRRHLGVATACVAVAHGGLALVWYHGFGDVDPLVSLLANGTGDGVPFQPLGLVALAILVLMAATSHDFWLANLGPRAWKQLHLLAYLAFAALIAHVAWGAMQTAEGPLVPALLGAAVVTVGTLHVAAGLAAHRADAARAAAKDGWLDAGPVDAIADGCAVRVATTIDRPIAVFRHRDAISAIAGTCVHQGGPLAEGRIVDGCVTCPWHGYQYRPTDGCSPPPFTEKLATHRVRVRDGRVEVEAMPQPPGTPVEPARIAGREVMR